MSASRQDRAEMPWPARYHSSRRNMNPPAPSISTSACQVRPRRGLQWLGLIRRRLSAGLACQSWTRMSRAQCRYRGRTEHQMQLAQVGFVPHNIANEGAIVIERGLDKRSCGMEPRRGALVEDVLAPRSPSPEVVRDLLRH